MMGASDHKTRMRVLPSGGVMLLAAMMLVSVDVMAETAAPPPSQVLPTEVPQSPLPRASGSEATASPSDNQARPLPKACVRADFEDVVEASAVALRDLTVKNKPVFQGKLRDLKTKRNWSHEQFLNEAAPFVRDNTTAVFDRTTEELLSAISRLGNEGAHAVSPDCAMLLELRARMKLLVETQRAKWSYMFEKIDTEMWR